MKLTVIGGGGVRSMFLAKSIALSARELNIRELVLMDIDEEKLRIFGTMAKVVAGKLCPEMVVTLSSDAKQAVTDADYVITTIRTGGDRQRVVDERAALNLGLLGQETTGAAGFSFAMRSIPVLLDYCELIRKYSKPSVKVFNFTNPAGIVSQAMRDAGYNFTYGICDAPSGMLHKFAELLGVNPEEIHGECYGINHLSFFQSVTVGDENVTDRIIEDDNIRRNSDLRFFERDLLQHIGTIPNEYLYYYYYREKAIANILEAGVTRGETICEVNENMLAELREMDVEADFDKALAVFEKWYGYREKMYMARETGVSRQLDYKFDIFSPDYGGYAGVALRYIKLVGAGKSGDMIMCVPNRGAIVGLEYDDVVEVTVTVNGELCLPHRFEDIPLENLELIRRVKLYERLGARAILERDRDLAISALTLHPLVNSYSLARTLVDEYIDYNADYIGGFR